MRNLLPQLERRRAEGGVRSATAEGLSSRVRPRLAIRGRLLAYGLAAVVLVGVVAFVWSELASSRLQARLLVPFARDATFALARGAAPDPWFPVQGPYDERLGYTRIGAVTQRLAEQGYAVEAQARLAPRLRSITAFGLFPPYREKSSAGLRIEDRRGATLFAARYPETAYADFESIPRVLVDSLLYVENRELLDETHPTRNPAVEWDRFGRAALNRLLRLFDHAADGAGGSTLATQIEKFRHSPQGITHSPAEKVRQIASASLRAYQSGEDTSAVRRQLVVDYLNSVPLAALPGYGEVIGLGDGLRAWYGADFERVNQLCADAPAPAAEGVEEEPARALAFRQALSLLLSVRAPSYYLLGHPDALAERTDTYLRLLAAEGRISPRLRDAALAVETRPRERALDGAALDGAGSDASSAVRVRLLPLLAMPDLYALDRLDLEVQSTLDGAVQADVLRLLHELRDPARAAAAGLIAPRLLDRGNPAEVTYSFSLFERTPGQNVVRVQADNLDQPLDVNDGAKLDLGSTAKLRTLATYLEIISDLHSRYAGRPAQELARQTPHPSDRITRWALDELRARGDVSLEEFLAAALERRYSASPYERFFTGGGLHRFANFDSTHDGRVMSVREAFRNSVNLVFIRVMRDIVAYYMFRVPGSSASLLLDAQDPRRDAYLRRFADREGRSFLDRFYHKYAGADPSEALERLLRGVRPTPRRIAVTLRSVAPELELDAFSAALRARLPQSELSDETLARLYSTYGPDRFDLADRGYLARVHPLELWLVAYLRERPGASYTQVVEASSDERIAVYRWLFKTSRKNAQDKRIRTLLEIEAFLEVHKQWKRLGYPFESLVPSYATAIGSSADRPAALAELVGIILNDGARQPTARIRRLRFGADTPYETRFVRQGDAGERVMRREVSAALRAAMIEVVDGGTAVRARNAIAGPTGTPIPVGGKTGTGDHRFKVFGPGANLLESHVVSRTATFVFFIGDGLYGVVTAYVHGPEAANYGFTSSLPTQLFKVVAPSLAPLLERGASADRGA